MPYFVVLLIRCACADGIEVHRHLFSSRRATERFIRRCIGQEIDTTWHLCEAHGTQAERAHLVQRLWGKARCQLRKSGRTNHPELDTQYIMRRVDVVRARSNWVEPGGKKLHADP